MLRKKKLKLREIVLHILTAFVITVATMLIAAGILFVVAATA